MLYVGLNVPTDVLQPLLGKCSWIRYMLGYSSYICIAGISSTAELSDYVYGLPNIASAEADVLKRFILRLNYDKPYAPLVQVIRYAMLRDIPKEILE